MFKKLFIHFGLFLLAFFTTTLAGVGWENVNPLELRNLPLGLQYSIAVMFIIATHEFGHYFAARYHNVDATLPYFIPFPNFIIPYLYNPFGTMGAVIRTKSIITSKKVMFDIGVAGPIAGFIATLIVLIYGFTHLPGIEFILKIHPDYFLKPSDGQALTFGNSILYQSLSFLLTDPTRQFVPPMTEMYHYPFLCAGWFGLFITSMNMIPAGQLDGGHISYSMFGERHHILANVSIALLLVIGGMGLLPMYNIDVPFGWAGWLFWAFILLFLIKPYHPEIDDDTELNPARKIIGWISLIILILSFTPSALFE
jgi:membrane-associated protease RseP (regulator of RpoE activity)